MWTAFFESRKNAKLRAMLKGSSIQKKDLTSARASPWALAANLSDMEKAIMSKTITKEDIALLVANASEMFDETGCVPGLDGEEVPAERMVPHAKQYISETIDDSKALCD